MCGTSFLALALNTYETIGNILTWTVEFTNIKKYFLLC